LEVIGHDRLDIVGKTPCLISPEYQPNGKKSEDHVVEVVRDSFLQWHNAFEWMYRRFDGRDILVQVKTAGNGLDGLNAFMEWSPHAVLMDMRMHVTDGYKRYVRSNRL